MKSSSHVKPQLVAYCLGDLSDSEADAVRRHLDECKECAAAASDLAADLHTIRDAFEADGKVATVLEPDRVQTMLAVRPAKPRKLFFHNRILALAGCLVAILFFSVIIPSSLRQESGRNLVIKEANCSPSQDILLATNPNMRGCEDVADAPAVPDSHETSLRRDEKSDGALYARERSVPTVASSFALDTSDTEMLKRETAHAPLPGYVAEGNVLADASRSVGSVRKSDFAPGPVSAPGPGKDHHSGRANRSNVEATAVAEKRSSMRTLGLDAVTHKSKSLTINEGFIDTRRKPLATFPIGSGTSSFVMAQNSLSQGIMPAPETVWVGEFLNALDYNDKPPEDDSYQITIEGAPSPFGRKTQLIRLAVVGQGSEQKPESKDAEVCVEWNPDNVIGYNQLGYENNAQAASSDSAASDKANTGRSTSALYEILMSGTPPSNPDAPLGSVSLRFLSTDGAAVCGKPRKILQSDIAPSFAKARPEFRIAAISAGFAERLRNSPYAPVQNYSELADMLRPVVKELRPDPRNAEMKQLIDYAADLTQ